MTHGCPFTIRSDDKGVTISFDGGTDVSYGPELSEKIIDVLEAAHGSGAVFSAATLASFAEAERAWPEPAIDGQILDLAALQVSYGDGAVVPLGARVYKRTGLFAEVLARRRSERRFGAVSLDDIATLLVRSARVLTWSYDDRGVEMSLRPYPSAGAMHPLSIELIATQVNGLAAGSWAFDALRCVLAPTRRSRAEVTRCLDELAKAVGNHSIPAAIVVIANPARTLARYPCGTAHVWRDAGALLATLHLAATDLGLASTIVGTSGVLDSFDRVASTRVDVGALAVGATTSTP